MSPEEAPVADGLVEASFEAAKTVQQDGGISRDESSSNVVHNNAIVSPEEDHIEDSLGEASIEATETLQQDGSNDRDESSINVMPSSAIISPDETHIEDDLGEASIEATETVQQGDSSSHDENSINVMHASGQTYEERREIRRAQRLLFTKVVETGDDLDVQEVRGENNEIFSKVNYPREAILDGANMNVIAGRAAQKADRLFKVPRYDADRLICKLVSKCRNSDGDFDWLAFGDQAGACFNAMPANVSFLNGSLTNGGGITVRQRVTRVRLVEEDAEEEVPEDITTREDENPDRLSATQKSMKDMEKTLKTRVLNTYFKNKRKLQEIHEGGEIPPRLNKKLKKHGVEIDAIRFLFNPYSFTQTVENIFHFSFLVKEGLAALRVRKTAFGDDFGNSDAPGGLACHYVEDAKNHHSPNTQSVMSLTMQDWRDLCNAYDVKNGDLPYRTGSTQTKTVELSQESESSDDSS